MWYITHSQIPFLHIRPTISRLFGSIVLLVDRRRLKIEANNCWKNNNYLLVFILIPVSFSLLPSYSFLFNLSIMHELIVLLIKKKKKKKHKITYEHSCFKQLVKEEKKTLLQVRQTKSRSSTSNDWAGLQNEMKIKREFIFLKKKKK